MSDRPNPYLENSDALSAVLSRLQLTAEIYVNGDFCGAWAVDTSGSRRIPFHLIGTGEAWLHMEGQTAQRLSSGDLIIFPHDHRHTMAHSDATPPQDLINVEPTSQDGPTTHMICGFFEFQNKASWPLLDSLSPVLIVDLSDFDTAPTARNLIDLMVDELSRQPPGFYTVINHLAYLLFIHVIRLQISTGNLNSGLLAAMFDNKIGKALNAIHNQPAKRWTLESLAGEATMGRSSFARRFNEITGLPPMQYLTAWRMQEAKALLETTTLSVAKIAEQCGYESEPAFRKVFKKTTGENPGAVRRSLNPHP